MVHRRRRQRGGEEARDAAEGGGRGGGRRPQRDGPHPSPVPASSGALAEGDLQARPPGRVAFRPRGHLPVRNQSQSGARCPSPRFVRGGGRRAIPLHPVHAGGAPERRSAHRRVHPREKSGPGGGDPGCPGPALRSRVRLPGPDRRLDSRPTAKGRERPAGARPACEGPPAGVGPSTPAHRPKARRLACRTPRGGNEVGEESA